MTKAQYLSILRHHQPRGEGCVCGADVVGAEEHREHLAAELVAVGAEVRRLEAQQRANAVSARDATPTGTLYAADVEERHLGHTVVIGVAGGRPVHGQLLRLDRYTDVGMYVFEVLSLDTTTAGTHVLGPNTPVIVR